MGSFWTQWVPELEGRDGAANVTRNVAILSLCNATCLPRVDYSLNTFRLIYGSDGGTAGADHGIRQMNSVAKSLSLF